MIINSYSSMQFTENLFLKLKCEFAGHCPIRMMYVCQSMEPRVMYIHVRVLVFVAMECLLL